MKQFPIRWIAVLYLGLSCITCIVLAKQEPFRPKGRRISTFGKSSFLQRRAHFRGPCQPAWQFTHRWRWKVSVCRSIAFCPPPLRFGPLSWVSGRSSGYSARNGNVCKGFSSTRSKNFFRPGLAVGQPGKKVRLRKEADGEHACDLYQRQRRAQSAQLRQHRLKTTFFYLRTSQAIAKRLGLVWKLCRKSISKGRPRDPNFPTRHQNPEMEMSMRKPFPSIQPPDFGGEKHICFLQSATRFPADDQGDFGDRSNVRVEKLDKDAGYRIHAAEGKAGFALKKLARPLQGKSTFKFHLETA